MTVKRSKISVSCACAAALITFLIGTAAQAGEAVESEDGKYYDAEGEPTYHIADDGAVDWYTYSGFRRYHSECHVCHGPDGLGSSFGPALVDSLKTMSYSDFLNVVVNGRQVVDAADQYVMPSFGLNKNVMCFIDDLYVYLKARSDGALGRGRPPKHDPKPKTAKEEEDACMGS
jgi:methanol metabolism-related c-type cytochrome